MVVCAGFEDRAVEALKRICASGKTDISIGVINYLPPYKENKTEEILNLAGESNFHVEKFVYNRQDPAGIGEKLCEFAKSFNRIFIDISGMSRLLIVQALVALIPEKRPITIIYSEAENYPPSREEFDKNPPDANAGAIMSYLSSGIFDIAITPELSSVSMQGAPVRLLAFPSFDHIQLKNLLHELQPTYANIIHGIPPEEKNKWRTEAVRKLNQPNLNSLHKPVDYYVSTLDYRKTLMQLLDVYAERSMFDRIVVAPTGSKMQSVAVGLFRAVLYDIQIVYPTPHTFDDPNQYTTGVRQLYALDLPENIIEKNKVDDGDPAVQEQGSG